MERPTGLNIKKLRGENYYRGFIVALSSFLLAFIFASIFMPVQNSDATQQQVTATVSDGEGGTISVLAPSVNMEVTASAAGSYRSSASTINVSTDAETGYKLYISTAYSTDDGRLYLNGDASSSSIVATSGTFSAPAKLSANSWGYALNQNDIDNLMEVDPSITQESPFNDSYTTPTPTSSSLWSSIPNFATPQKIRQEDSPTGDGGSNTTVYYGIYANAALPYGTYSGSVLYTAVSEGNISGRDALAVYPTSVNTYRETVTLRTPAGAINTVGAVKVFIGGTSADTRKECTDVSADIVDNYITVTCSVPWNDAGSQTIYMTLVDYNTTLTLENGLEYIYDNINTCSDLTTAGQLATLHGQKVYKLADNNCWQIANYTSTNWNARSCPSGFYVPGTDAFNAVLSSVGSGNQLYNLGWSGRYWTNDGTGSYSNNYAYYFNVTSWSANVSAYGDDDGDRKTNVYPIRCYTSS